MRSVGDDDGAVPFPNPRQQLAGKSVIGRGGNEQSVGIPSPTAQRCQAQRSHGSDGKVGALTKGDSNAQTVGGAKEKGDAVIRRQHIVGRLPDDFSSHQPLTVGRSQSEPRNGEGEVGYFTVSQSHRLLGDFAIAEADDEVSRQSSSAHVVHLCPKLPVGFRV